MKKNIISFILGAISMLVVSVTANILYNAKDIEFTSNNDNWKVTNVEDAINDLFLENVDLNKISLSSSNSGGGRIYGRNTALNVNPGKYIFVGINGSTAYDVINMANTNINTGGLELKSNNDNMECKLLKDITYNYSATSYYTSNYYLRIWDKDMLWYCETSKDSVVTLTQNYQSDASTNGQAIRLYAIKLK